MRKVAIAPSFERSLKRLSPSQRKQVFESISHFYDFTVSGLLLPGFGFKKLTSDIYEFRAGILLRILVKSEGDYFILIFVGSHDDIRRYLT